MKLLALLGAMACACMPSRAPAQTAVDVRAPSGYAPVQAPCVQQPNGSCTPISAANPLPVTGGGSTVATSTDASGTVATANVYQTVFAASSTRRGCLIQNTSAGVTISVRFGTSAPLTLSSGGLVSCSQGLTILGDQVTLTSATAGASFTALSQ